MKKIFVTFCILVIAGCASRQPRDPQMCFDMRKCYNVRVIHDVVEVKGINRVELADLGACDENQQFHRVKRYGKLNESFFYGISDRTCMATLQGC